ncbi:hypothetical protein ABZ321_56440, partial [Dactylosporangium sp. NPDC006015]
MIDPQDVRDRIAPRILVAGEPVAGLRHVPTVDPSTGAPLADVPVADAATVDRAVRAAAAAQPA